MKIRTDHYDVDVPDGHAADIIADIGDEVARNSILDAVEAAGEGEAVRLPLGLADVLLNAFSEWERSREGGEG